MKSTENPTESGSASSLRLLNETADTSLGARLDQIAILCIFTFSRQPRGASFGSGL